jgi:hypothetical protein
MWEMTANDLISVLESFNGDSEVAIEVAFPGLDGWTVKTYSFSYGPDESSDGPKLGFSIYGSNFDYPDILRVLKDRVAAIPEGYCTPK